MKFNNNKNLFFPYLLFGYPSKEGFTDLFEAAQDHADLIEIGIPFSDPVADGPVIQSAVTEVLKSDFSLESILKFLSDRKKRTRLALMSYANPIWNYGLDEFTTACKQSNVDALIVPDVPFEESEPWRQACTSKDIALVSFISLQTGRERLAKIVKNADGFIYLLSLTGVTGSQIQSENAVRKQAALIRAITQIPIALGFGIRNVSDARRYSEEINAFIVGSRLIEVIQELKSTEAGIRFLSAFASELKQGRPEDRL